VGTYDGQIPRNPGKNPKTLGKNPKLFGKNPKILGKIPTFWEKIRNIWENAKFLNFCGKNPKSQKFWQIPKNLRIFDNPMNLGKIAKFLCFSRIFRKIS